MKSENTQYEYTINITGLTKVYPAFTMDNLNFKLQKGTVMGLIGQNGAGKTTLIKSLLNLIRWDAGNIEIFGLDNKSNEKAIKNDIGVVFDELGIPESLNCKMVNSIMKNIYSNWNSESFFEYTTMFKLPVDKAFKKFSRGMRMKLQIAVALSHDAKLLILDEATSGLDPVSRNELLDILLEYMEDENHSILMSSHITSDLERVADYITFIDGGTILLQGDKYDIANGYSLAKGTQEVVDSIPKEYVVSIRKNSYGAEALVNKPGEVEKLGLDIVLDKVSLDNILCFYVKKNSDAGKEVVK